MSSDAVYLRALAALPAGGRAVFIFAESVDKDAFVKHWSTRVVDGMSFAYASTGKTLLADFSVLDNLRLPLSYRQAQFVWANNDLQRLCRLADIDGTELLSTLVANASRLQRIQASLLQAALLNPQVLLLDGIFESLGASERSAAGAAVDAFHSLYPLRRSVYLSLSLPLDEIYHPVEVINP